MRLNYEIEDNFLPYDLYKQISSLLLSNGFPYYFYPSINNEEKSPDFFFVHMLVESGVISSWYYNNLVPHFTNRLGSAVVSRVKVNAYPRDFKHTVHGFHTDHDEPHLVALWCANTNNGYTLIKDNYNDIEVKIDSVANRMIFFEGSTLHSSVTQTDEKLRVNINFNYRLKSS